MGRHDICPGDRIANYGPGCLMADREVKGREAKGREVAGRDKRLALNQI